ncbi:MAG: hypothetical protein KF851_15265 [Pirellulaceae bacterium]|nr:hypothetical protein [Pirellulaceae bacterium]
MAIQVTCPSCLTRFSVSDKFAGREGPCPKCKAPIQIPSKAEEVLVHAPETSGPKDSKGRPVLKPIARQETNLSQVQITLIIGVILLFFVGALAFRFTTPSPTPYVAEAFGWALVILLAIPCAFAGYSFLRDQERGSFLGRELWIRVSVTGTLYALTWLSMWIAYYMSDNKWGAAAWGIGATAMILLGGGIGLAALDFEYLNGVLHYGLYFGCCLLARFIAGIGLFPGTRESELINESTVVSMAGLAPYFELALSCLG